MPTGDFPNNPTPLPGTTFAPVLVPSESRAMVMGAYRDLMTGPLPTCDKDFRRAVMLAVLIGRQIEADCREAT